MTCKSPQKIRHANREAALGAIRKLYKAGRGNPDYSAYPCGDHWHVGHDVVHFKQRIQRSLRVNRKRSRR